MKKIALALSVSLLIASQTTMAEEATWEDVWGSVKDTSGLIWKKTGVAAKDAVVDGVETTNDFLNDSFKKVKETEINVVMPAPDQEGNIADKVSNGWKKTKGFFTGGKTEDEVDDELFGKPPAPDYLPPVVEAGEERPTYRTNDLSDEEMIINPGTQGIDDVPVFRVHEVK